MHNPVADIDYNPYAGGSVENETLAMDCFAFEADFVEDNIRCIPMIVRFKMDATGIKLKLAEWSRFEKEERAHLSKLPCISLEEQQIYQTYLLKLIKIRSGNDATMLLIDPQPEWADKNLMPELVILKAYEYRWQISMEQWRSLTNLQRFVLLKLCKEGHENKNFPKAMIEFGLALSNF